MLCQVHAAVLSYIAKWQITVVCKSNYSVQCAAIFDLALCQATPLHSSLHTTKLCLILQL